MGILEDRIGAARSYEQPVAPTRALTRAKGAEVEAACGPPTQFDSGAIYHGTVAGTGQSNVARTTAIAQPVEIWTYNFGPGMLMQRIRIVDGVVVSLEHLGYGYPLP